MCDIPFWQQIFNVATTIVLAGAAVWSVWTARRIADRKNPAPYGQLRILWIIERMLEDLERSDYENADVNLKSLNRHFFNHGDPYNRDGKNPESGDWYFVWDTEKAFIEFTNVASAKPIINVLNRDLDQPMAIAKAKKC